MEVKAITELKNEHQGIELGLAVLTKITQKKSDEDASGIADLENLINFFKVFADKCHHGKEERILFLRLEKKFKADEQRLVAEILKEHVQGRNYVRQMGEALAQNQSGRQNKWQDLILAADNYASLLGAHIKKENEIVFPKLASLINQEQDLEIFEKYEELEKKVIGKGTHEKLHKLLDYLKEKYL